MAAKINAANILLMLPGLSVLALYADAEYIPILIGLVLGLPLTFFLEKLSMQKALTYTVIAWLAFALAATVLNSSYLAIASASYLITSLGYVAITEELGSGSASLIFFLTYLVPESSLEVVKLGLPPYKYLPYLIKLGSGRWSVPDISTRIIYAISAGYLLTAYFLSNIKGNSLTISVLVLSGIYTVITAVLTSLSGLPNAYYVAAIMGLLPLAILTLSLKVEKV